MRSLKGMVEYFFDVCKYLVSCNLFLLFLICLMLSTISFCIFCVKRLDDMKVNEDQVVNSTTKKMTKRMSDRILNTSVQLNMIFLWNSSFAFIVVTFEDSYNVLCCLYVLTWSWLWRTIRRVKLLTIGANLRCLWGSWLHFWRNVFSCFTTLLKSHLCMGVLL